MRKLMLAGVLALCALTAWAQGPVTLGGVTYDHVDPGEAFTMVPEAPQDWASPAPSAAEKAAGMLAYLAPDPGEYVPHRLPKAEEHTARLQAFLAPGEDEAVTWGLWSLAELKGLTVTVDLKGAPLTVDIRQAHCWPQRTGWSSRRAYVTPELLLPCAGGMKSIPYQRGVLREVSFDVPAGESQGLWLTLTAAEDAAPGVYHATVSVAAAGRKALELPLDVEVLPFKLQRPTDRFWTLYADAGRWSSMSNEQVLAELRDFRRHGMDGLIEIPLGTPDLSRIKEGKVSYDASAFRRYADLCHQVGMDGPHVVGSGGAGMVRDAVAPGTNLDQGQWPAEVTAGLTAVAKAAVDATADLPAKWYYYGVDEPTGDNTYAIQDNQAWHAGGARTYATFYVPSFLEKAAAYLTAPCFVVGLISAEQNAREAREECEKTGAEFWWYGTGSYVNPYPQEGHEWSNRYGAGLLFWKSGARTEATWTFCRPHEDVFNDFDGSAANGAEPKEQCTAYPHFLKPDDWSTYQGAIPTLAWEAMREGVDDYLYLYTLTDLIQQAKASPLAAAQTAAGEAQATLDGLVESVPWANPMGPVAFEDRQLQQLRRAVADQIVTLQAALRGDAEASAARREERFSLQVTTRQAAGKAPLPVMALPTCTQAPTVDGTLDDVAWKTAGVAEGFVDIDDDRPSALGTRALATAGGEALYVAFECPEPQMDKVRATETKHDGTVWLEDGVEVFVAGAKRRPYAHLIVTTQNVVLDEANQDANAWNPKLQTAVSRGKAGWSVEMAIPWAELAGAGVRREPVMTLNFGRSRYTAGDPQPHTAWACTYSGFHVPERFGMAMLQTETLALRSVSAPSAWGAQALGLTLQNTSTRGVQAQVRVRGAGCQTAGLAGGASRSFSFPLSFRRPGERPVSISWGLAGQTACSVELPAQVPPAAEVALKGGVVAPGKTVQVGVNLGLSAEESARHELVVRVTDGRGTWEQSLPAQAGQSVRVPVRTTGAAQVVVLLRDRSGRVVWQSAAQHLVCLKP
jgi:hypothetical protein